VCDDGGPDSEYESCALGTDCDHCGPRAMMLSPPLPPLAQSWKCFNSCQPENNQGRFYGTPEVSNGVCQDGGDGADQTYANCASGEPCNVGYGNLPYGGSTCAYGTDCADCGPRPMGLPAPSPPPLPPPLSPLPPFAPGDEVLCYDGYGYCYGGYASNGVCNDGGPGSLDAACAFGTDCADCGPRVGPPITSSVGRRLDAHSGEYGRPADGHVVRHEPSLGLPRPSGASRATPHPEAPGGQPRLSHHLALFDAPRPFNATGARRRLQLLSSVSPSLFIVFAVGPNVPQVVFLLWASLAIFFCFGAPGSCSRKCAGCCAGCAIANATGWVILGLGLGILCFVASSVVMGFFLDHQTMNDDMMYISNPDGPGGTYVPMPVAYMAARDTCVGAISASINALALNFLLLGFVYMGAFAASIFLCCGLCFGHGSDRNDALLNGQMGLGRSEQGGAVGYATSASTKKGGAETELVTVEPLDDKQQRVEGETAFPSASV